MLWILLVLFYGINKGVRDGLKKLAMQKSSLMEVLLLHSALTFLFTVPFSRAVFSIPASFYGLIFLKSFIIFLAWIFSFVAIEKMPLSYCGVMDLSRVVFSTVIGMVILGEPMHTNNLIGLILVLGGLFLVNLRRNETSGQGDTKYVFLMLAACFLNAVSAMMDKLYTVWVTPGQLQFWYMFYMTALYVVYTLATRTKIRLSQLKTNPYLWILSILFVLADRALFIANKDPASQMTVMTLIKQSSVLVTVLFGKMIFHEKKIGFKLVCSLVILIGIAITLL